MHSSFSAHGNTQHIAGDFRVQPIQPEKGLDESQRSKVMDTGLASALEALDSDRLHFSAARAELKI